MGQVHQLKSLFIRHPRKCSEFFFKCNGVCFNVFFIRNGELQFSGAMRLVLPDLRYLFFPSLIYVRLQTFSLNVFYFPFWPLFRIVYNVR